jgi:hypothetical protein
LYASRKKNAGITEECNRVFDDDFNAINVLAMVATARRTPLAL